MVSALRRDCNDAPGQIAVTNDKRLVVDIVDSEGAAEAASYRLPGAR